MMEKGRRVQYFVAFALSLATATLGVSSAWPTPVLPKFKKNETDITITENEISTMMGLSAPGFLVGSLITSFISDTFGRRTTVLLSAIPFTFGTFLAAIGKVAWMLYVTKFSWGFGTGMVSSVVTIYLAETSDSDIRATLSVSTRFMFNLGSLLITSVGAFMSYTTLNYSILVMPAIFFITCLFIPESPYYYLKEGKVDSARKSLLRLKDRDNIDNELKTLESNVSKEMKNSSSIFELFKGKKYGRPITIALGLKITQIMTGTLTIQQYLGRITEDIDRNMKLSTHLIIFAAVKFIVGLITTVIADRVGRRPLLIYSYIGTSVMLAISGTFFFLKEVIHLDDPTLHSIRYVPFSAIIASNVISLMGFNSIIGIIQAEIFPINVRAHAMTSLNVLGGLLGFLVPKCYQGIINVSGYCGVFWVFSAVAITGAIFSYFVVPETKGKTLSEIQDLLQIGVTVVPDEANEKMCDIKINEESLELMEQKKNGGRRFLRRRSLYKK